MDSQAPPEQKLLNIKAAWLYRLVSKSNALILTRLSVQAWTWSTELKYDIFFQGGPNQNIDRERNFTVWATSWVYNYRDRHRHTTSQGTAMTSSHGVFISRSQAFLLEGKERCFSFLNRIVYPGPPVQSQGTQHNPRFSRKQNPSPRNSPLNWKVKESELPSQTGNSENLTFPASAKQTLSNICNRFPIFTVLHAAALDGSGVC